MFLPMIFVCLCVFISFVLLIVAVKSVLTLSISFHPFIFHLCQGYVFARAADISNN